jgi:nicotinate-nucleotide pyrophosphorylase (carboxylating)
MSASSLQPRVKAQREDVVGTFEGIGNVFATDLPDPDYIKSRIDEALREDGAEDDCTVAFLGLVERSVSGRLVARGAGVVAGVDVARTAFAKMDPGVRFDPRRRDGDRVQSGDVIANIRGRAVPILSAERVALNFLQRLSGVATLTARFVEAVRGTGVKILDTRKTTPLLRPLERYAVRVGGGGNHRYNLSDMILIKENHIKAVGGRRALAELLSGKTAERMVEVEVDTVAFLRELLGHRVDRVMLDNFSPDEVRQAMEDIAVYRKKRPACVPKIEVSGEIHLDNIRAYANEGPDYISIGALTHSAPALDISLEVEADGR